MDQHIEKFQRLLRELFQFNCADLDFGIYRIMNYKRDVIERFITKDLPAAISQELDRGALADQSQATKELKEVAEQIRKDLNEDALDADGTLAQAYHNTRLGRKYLDLKTKAAGGRGREALEANIFNHLYTFFSRYYQDGDFISKRRYSKRQRYAIPYNGEEVYLYWANNDQYYVKTAEHFHDYAFTSRGVTVHFKLQAASVEQNNVKGDKRFFLPRAKEVEWKEEAGELVLPFEYRPLTEQEEIACGKKNQQDTIIARALEQISERLKKADRALAALTAERRKDSDDQPVTFLEHHLRQYTRRNTSDFFIHKDLKSFLARELDFYLKNEVLNLDEMESAGEDRAEGWFQMTRTIKAVGGRIIDFLDQIESFQKMLWEKRKFITETQYCVTIGNMDEGFYPDIAACEPQWAEWKALFHIDEEQSDLFTVGKNKKDKRIAFLKVHPTLVLDTKHFDQRFVDRLLGSFEDLDEMTDGLLIHSENWQALNLFMEKYREAIKAVYIDPPYNTFATKIIYKNEYEHSSWLSLLENRLLLAYHLMATDGITCTTIDDYELHRLVFLMERVFGANNHLATVAIRNNPSGRSTVKGFAINHEYGLFFCRSSNEARVGRMPHTEAQIARYDESDEDGQSFEWENFRKSSAGSYRFDRPRQYFPLYCDRQTRALRIPRIEWQEATRSWKVLESPGKAETVILPKDTGGGERVWRYGIERTLQVLGDALVEETPNGLQVYTKKYLQARGSLPRTWWDKTEYSARDNGTRALADLFGSEKPFDFPKAPAAVMDSIRVCAPGESGLVLDYFGGSGTTGHAVMNLNRQDDEGIGFILVEMGDYFDTVLLPRIKKVTFTPEWKDGKPKRMATREEAERSPRIVKYIRIEGYEDALNNIEFDDASGQQALKFDDYLLKYMLKWETRASETLLNVEKLARPFSYKLHIHADGQTCEKVADVPETFNYLLGLHVRTRRVYDDEGRRYLVYRGRIDHRQIAVIWRETEGWQKADLEQDKKFVAMQKLTEGADEVFVNGDSFIPNARALEPVF
ncbi:MAG: site-specific DNA-methyltransferase, partial [Proteobacteria bacterium]|nr:site-specific DNA-methyltransferase [Pseudomonadota bacterium]